MKDDRVTGDLIAHLSICAGCPAILVGEHRYTSHSVHSLCALDGPHSIGIAENAIVAYRPSLAARNHVYATQQPGQSCGRRCDWTPRAPLVMQDRLARKPSIGRRYHP